MSAWNKLSNRLMIVGALLLVSSLVSTPAIGADNDDKLNGDSEESQTTDSEISIALINSLAAEKEKGNLKGFDLDLQVKNGTVELRGSVATNEQLKLLLCTAQNTRGVNEIKNHISIKTSKGSTPPTDDGAILRELAEARRLIRQLDQRLERLEAEVSKRGTNAQTQPAWPTSSTTGYPGYAWPTYARPSYPIPPGWTPLKVEWDDGNWQLFPVKDKTKEPQRATATER